MPGGEEEMEGGQIVVDDSGVYGAFVGSHAALVTGRVELDRGSTFRLVGSFRLRRWGG